MGRALLAAATLSVALVLSTLSVPQAQQGEVSADTVLSAQSTNDWRSWWRWLFPTRSGGEPTRPTAQPAPRPTTLPAPQPSAPATPPRTSAPAAPPSTRPAPPTSTQPAPPPAQPQPTTAPAPPPGGAGPVAGPIASGPTQAQPAAIVYGTTAGLDAYAKPGALVIAGRDNYADAAFGRVAAAGGTVLGYIDPIIDNPYGRYHTLLMKQSGCGPAVPLWPGSPRANEWGNLTDFRVGGVLQSKLECVLETMANENPALGGFFADDVGSRSWFPQVKWDSWSAADQQAYRDGAIAITRTFRKVADRHQMLVMVNGTWTAGTVARSGGGYPSANVSGNSLADGGFVEYHDGEVAFFGPYGCAAQWADGSATTRGRAVNMVVSRSDAASKAYAATGCFAYASRQTDYGVTPQPWGAFIATGLPTRR